jgi:AmiR/NasT family two-component response regulator
MIAPKIILFAPEPAPAESLRRAAEEFGRVVVASKPAMTIYLAAVHEPLVAIIDLDALRPDGRPGLVATLGQRFQVSIVGLGSADTIQAADNLALAAALTKPVNSTELMLALDRIFAERLNHR